MSHHSTMCIPGTVPAIAGSFIGDLAEYLVLARHDLERSSRFGDMSRARRGREVNRLGDALISDGYKFGRLSDGTFGFVDSVDVRRIDLEAAFERVLRPRVNRLMSEPGYHYRTRHSLAAFDAYAATLDWIKGQA